MKKKPATEQTYAIEFLRVPKYGKNFENIPSCIEGARDRNNIYWSDFTFIDTNGNEYQTFEHINIHKMEDYNKVMEIKRSTKLKDSNDVLLAACVVTLWEEHRNTKSKYLYFFSKLYTPNDINTLRKNFFNKVNEEKINKNISLIETIWK